LLPADEDDDEVSANATSSGASLDAKATAAAGDIRSCFGKSNAELAAAAEDAAAEPGSGMPVELLGGRDGGVARRDEG
jgi:hypothetical protein